MSVIDEFKAFALRGNVVDLAIGVVIGGAFGKIITGMVDDLIMPLVSLVIPGGDWRNAGLTIKEGGPPGPAGDTRLLFGHLAGVALDFLIVALVLFFIVRAINRLSPPPAANVRACPECLEMIPKAAKRCKSCTSEVGAVG